MDDVEPLRMPPQVLYMGKHRAFLLRWRRRMEGGIVCYLGLWPLPAGQSEMILSGT
ncbi:hypothetical protein ACTWPT_13520 [Nonomuraea sp. 3N208]|uniref:hypothetical protein n=1 Tax=Nonomuraea sp. 3N208 TaxID=3457421 RepID=UPI003FCCC15B